MLIALDTIDRSLPMRHKPEAPVLQLRFFTTCGSLGPKLDHGLPVSPVYGAFREAVLGPAFMPGNTGSHSSPNVY
jgi:hypothetical protein